MSSHVFSLDGLRCHDLQCGSVATVHNTHAWTLPDAQLAPINPSNKKVEKKTSTCHRSGARCQEGAPWLPIPWLGSQVYIHIHIYTVVLRSPCDSNLPWSGDANLPGPAIQVYVGPSMQIYQTEDKPFHGRPAPRLPHLLPQKVQRNGLRSSRIAGAPRPELAAKPASGRSDVRQCGVRA
eukprot:355287-Chlamydomonas_euryale.AAC.2